MESINETQDRIIEEFNLFDDWLGKYEHLIEYGKNLPLIDEKYKVDENLVSGCQSQVWLHTDFRNGKVYYTADGDAVITKGLVGLLLSVLSGHLPDEIINSDLYFIDKIGLKEHLSPFRSNGLFAMIKQMKMYALAYKTKEQQEN